MDWKERAIDDLRKYNCMSDSLTNIRERIMALTARHQAYKSTYSDTEPIQGGTSRYEDRLLNNIVERETLKLNYIATKRLVKLIEKGLNSLDKSERLTLDRFYINRPKEGGHIEQLMNDLHMEQSHVYRAKDAALKKFTRSMFGIIDY